MGGKKGESVAGELTQGCCLTQGQEREWHMSYFILLTVSVFPPLYLW